MPIEDHLMPGEVVLASSAFFYATDLRLVRYEPAPVTGPQAEALEYVQIQGLKAGVQTRYRLVVISFVVFLLGLLDPARSAQGGPVLKAVMMITGLIFLIYGILNRKTVWTVQSAALSKANQSRWRIQDDGDDRTRRLLQVIQGRITQPSPEPPAEKSASDSQPPPQTSSDSS
ncbi:MAG: hypothetical protein EXR67_03110 [Dehalococcoidia bacterium]|nr:hypothetical protein [Dehalococcoidia bacterium]